MGGRAGRAGPRLRKEAARSLVALPRAAGWTVVAYIHPGHLASQRVAQAAGLSPTTGTRDGEMRWDSPAAGPDARNGATSTCKLTLTGHTLMPRSGPRRADEGGPELGHLYASVRHGPLITFGAYSAFGAFPFPVGLPRLGRSVTAVLRAECRS